ncbi:DUF308 domain-containing protein [Pseudonocardia hierapolitana]|uniref:DUF308 domain-containing protein n=1 Tax=Pseudonocardia hierapolitana TaxID=1128676 RepID=UPI001478F8F2|nr:DUF308 domain-containing protein [Pseudonocardia hierapolitana]
MSGPMASATPESAAAPSAPPVADGATAAVGTAQPEVARQSRWRTVGVVALGLLIVFYGMLVISLRPAALAGVAVLAGIALIAGGVAQIALAGELERRWRWLGYLGGLVGVAAGVAAFAWPALTLAVLAVLTAWSLVVNGVFRIVGSVADRDRELWWVGLLAGAVELVLGSWAVAAPGRELLLMVNLIGIYVIIAGLDTAVSALRDRRLPDLR